MTSPTNEQKKVMMQQAFDLVADGYDNDSMRFFHSSAKHMVGLLGLKGDEKVLDVNTGTGAVALALAEHLPEGEITGIDLSQGMLNQAALKARQNGFKQITLLQMDMEKLAFPDQTFDVITCGFGLFFIEDMVSCLRNMKSKLKPKGKLVLTSFAEGAFEPWTTLAMDKLLNLGLQIPESLSWQRLQNEDLHQKLFSDASFSVSNTEQKPMGYFLEDEKSWFDILWFSGFRGLLNQLSEPDLKTFKNEHLTEIAQHKTDQGLKLTVDILFSVGIND